MILINMLGQRNTLNLEIPKFPQSSVSTERTLFLPRPVLSSTLNVSVLGDGVSGILITEMGLPGSSTDSSLKYSEGLLAEVLIDIPRGLTCL
jgi:hypothetical protein